MPKLLNAKTNEVILERLEIANTFWQRFKGLQLRHSMASENGILLSPCSSLHTCFMRFPIDIIMLDTHKVVVGIRRNIRPWRFVFCDQNTVQVIETNIDVADIALGTQLLFNAPLRGVRTQ